MIQVVAPLVFGSVGALFVIRWDRRCRMIISSLLRGVLLGIAALGDRILTVLIVAFYQNVVGVG